MATPEEFSVRDELLGELLQRVQDDTYPSATMLDMIESLLTPDEVPYYAAMLLEQIRQDRFPSWPMIQRVRKFA
ncbi:MAG: hypothetical protein ACRDOY_13600 [Nocardioidaceae bacterium]